MVLDKWWRYGSDSSDYSSDYRCPIQAPPLFLWLTRKESMETMLIGRNSNDLAGSKEGRHSTLFVLWISTSRGLCKQVGETWQLVDCNRAFGFRGSNSTSGHAVQANPTVIFDEFHHSQIGFVSIVACQVPPGEPAVGPCVGTKISLSSRTKWWHRANQTTTKIYGFDLNYCLWCVDISPKLLLLCFVVDNQKSIINFTKIPTSGKN